MHIPKYILSESLRVWVFSLLKKQKLANLTQIQSALELLTMPQGAAPKSIDEAKKKKYQFWETQPVPKFGKYLVLKMHIMQLHLPYPSPMHSASVAKMFGDDRMIFAFLVCVTRLPFYSLFKLAKKIFNSAKLSHFLP